MSNKGRVTIAVLLAYFVGFLLGCLGLEAIISSGSSEQGTGLKVLEAVQSKMAQAAMEPESLGNRASQKPTKARETAGQPGLPPDLLQFSYQVDVGDNASITIRTRPDAVCTIRYINPQSQDVHSPELTYQTANGEGLCTWVWSIPAGSPTGIGAVIVSADGVDATYFFNIR